MVSKRKQMSAKNYKSKKVNDKKKNKNKNKYNLVYMAKPPYGGWVSFTAHLANKFDYPLYKINNNTESKKRVFGYNVDYQNITIDDLVKLPNLLITCIDKKFYEYLPKIKSATIVIHDPTELKEPVLEALKRFKIITIRETVSKLLTKEYNLSNRFLYHPFYEFPKTETTKTKAISLSRVDFDKHTDIIIEANDKLPSNKQVAIYGALNDLYVYHKLRHTNFKKYYKGKFDKTFDAVNSLLKDCKFVVDMSAIKKDGGGSQYTFLEAIYMNCALILNKKWVDGVKTPFKHNVNCFIVETKDDLIKLLNSRVDTKQICKNARLMLKPHLKASGW